MFVQHVGADTGWGRTALAGVQTLARFPEAVVASALGPFVDRHGARWLTGIGALIVGVCFFALATSDQLWQLYAVKGLIMPIGAVGLGGFVAVTVSNWFVRKRGRALGFISLGSSLATAIMPLLAAFMIEHWGWRQAWALMGVLVIVLGVPALVLFRRRPEDLGMYPDGASPLLETVSEYGRPPTRAQPSADVVWTRGQLLRTPVLWLLVFCWGFSGFAVTATNLHIVPYLQDLGYPLYIAAGGVSLRAAAMVVAAPIWGYAVERIPITIAGCVQFLLKASAMLLLLLSPTPAGLIVALLLYGAGGAGSQVVQELVWANYYGRLSLGLVRSIVYPLQIGFAAFGPLVMGVAFDLSGSYQNAWAFLLAGFVLAAGMVLFSRPPRQTEPRDRGYGP